jgi:hypothetical protein
MGRLHDALKASGYEGYALEVLLMRLLFSLRTLNLVEITLGYFDVKE